MQYCNNTFLMVIDESHDSFLVVTREEMNHTLQVDSAKWIWGKLKEDFRNKLSDHQIDMAIDDTFFNSFLGV